MNLSRPCLRNIWSRLGRLLKAAGSISLTNPLSVFLASNLQSDPDSAWDESKCNANIRSGGLTVSAVAASTRKDRKGWETRGSPLYTSCRMNSALNRCGASSKCGSCKRKVRAQQALKCSDFGITSWNLVATASNVISSEPCSVSSNRLVCCRLSAPFEPMLTLYYSGNALSRCYGKPNEVDFLSGLLYGGTHTFCPLQAGTSERG
mmetsp:Transcript_25310/g.48023  ORF Transcript_25310/g.48023 Transcript_25310/m.48023 type:complete len:206 (+) Transcript_25310:1459-2076(+)